MKIINLKDWNSELDQAALVSLKGGATGGDGTSDSNKSYEYYWTHIASPFDYDCYSQDSRSYDEC